KNDLDGWQALAEDRRRSRRAEPLDVQAVLYGKVTEFIARSIAESARESMDEEAVSQAISDIHARWLMTWRGDLRVQAPRDVVRAKHKQVDWDLQDRAHQWSRIGTCPVGLSPEVTAHRFGGFGTHEIVLYYELVRLLIDSAWDLRIEPTPE